MLAMLQRSPSVARRPRVLYVTSRRASFIQLDRDLLVERYEVREHHQPGRLANPLAVLAAVRASDVVVGWWASWHTLLPFAFAWLLRRQSLLIVGGFDIACERDIGYGYQVGGVARWASRWIMRRASALMTNSEFSREEFARNTGLPGSRVTVVHHGVPDVFADDGARGQRSDPPLILTVGNVDAANLERKGLRLFVETATLVPEARFLLVGRVLDAAGEALRSAAPENASLSGWIADDELRRHYREASVYLQPSRHEGFGVSVAEAMLAQCVAVVTRAGALPEVVGDTGVVLADARPATVAAGIRRGLELAEAGAGARAREHVLAKFPVQRRREGLWRLVDALLEREPAG